MAANPVAHFPRQIQAAAVVLEGVHDAQALLVVPEPARHERIEDPFTGVAERRVTEIVAQCDRLGELFVQLQHLGDRPRNLRDLEAVREARAVVVTRRRKEDLRLVLQPPERLAVNDSIPVVLKRRAHVVFRLGMQTASRLGAVRGLWSEGLALALLEGFTNGRQRRPPGSWFHTPAVRPRSWRRVSARGRRMWAVSRRRRRASRLVQPAATARAHENGPYSASSDRCRGQR